MNGSISTVSGYVPCSGISLVYVGQSQDGSQFVVKVRTGLLEDVAVVGMVSENEDEARAYAKEVAVLVFGGATEWQE